MPYFCPLTAHFGGFEGVFSYINDKSAILCCVTAKVADFVSFKGSIVQGIKSFQTEKDFTHLKNDLVWNIVVMRTVAFWSIIITK